MKYHEGSLHDCPVCGPFIYSAYFLGGLILAIAIFS